MTHRGLQETTASLRDSNEQLQQRIRSVLDDHSATRSQLEEQRRLERLKDEFISIVSHELRTPLTSIHGSLGLVSEGRAGELPPKASQLVDIAYRNSQRLVRLVTDLLDLQKIESGSLAFDVRSHALASLCSRRRSKRTSPTAAGSRLRCVLGDVPRDACVLRRRRPVHAGADEPALERGEVLASPRRG